MEWTKLTELIFLYVYLIWEAHYYLFILAILALLAALYVPLVLTSEELIFCFLIGSFVIKLESIFGLSIYTCAALLYIVSSLPIDMYNQILGFMLNIIRTSLTG